MLTAEPTPVCGTYHHVQVVQIRRGPKRKEVLVFYGRIATLTWDPMNMWRGRINHTLAIQCSVCPRRVDESVLHRLWKCPSAQRAWQWAHPSVKSTCARDEREWAMAAPFMEAWSIFKQHPAQEHNDVFNDITWSPIKLLQSVWLGIVDYRRLEWSKVSHIRKDREAYGAKLAQRFENRWCCQDLFSAMANGYPHWVLSGPIASFVFQPPWKFQSQEFRKLASTRRGNA
uniref:Predicted protein n=1 Tax=Physcomitrium patens TaxID=3218 RepID=A9U2P3_PHYPA